MARSFGLGPIDHADVAFQSGLGQKTPEVSRLVFFEISQKALKINSLADCFVAVEARGTYGLDLHRSVPFRRGRDCT